MKLNVAIAGVNGNVGYQVLKLLEEFRFPVEQFYPIATEKSKGRLVRFNNIDYKCITVHDVDFSKVDVLFNAAGSKFAKEHVEEIAKKGCFVIDKTSYFRMFENVPLVVPMINQEQIMLAKDKIISVPNCVATPVACVMNKLHQSFGIKQAILSTYQSVSGAGAKAIDSLYSNTKRYFEASILQKNNDEYGEKIAFNCIPKIGDVEENGYTDEENKIINEIKRLISSEIHVSATSVRVPVFHSHAISATFVFDNKVLEGDIVESLKDDPNFVVSTDDNVIFDHKSGYGQHEVYVSRIRKDLAFDNAISMYIVSDNLLRGAALTAVEIARTLFNLK